MTFSRMTYFIIVLLAVLTFFAIDKYEGEFYIYLLFTVTSNCLLFIGFRRKSIFFDTFIGIFLWLGFWLKTTVHIIFYNARFGESVGSFDGTGLAFDKSLIIASIAFVTLIMASIVREKFIFNYPKKDMENSSLFYFYTNHRKKILIFYTLLFIIIATTNLYFSIYQRGGMTHENIPFVLTGIYKWLLLFGLSSFAALLLKYEFSMKKNISFLVPVLTLVEASITNTSLFSRGMMLNSSALGLALIKFTKNNYILVKAKYWLSLVFIFLFLFLFSVYASNKLRDNNYKPTNIEKTVTLSEKIKNVNITKGLKVVSALFINRSVGMEGLLAISSSSKKSWQLFYDAFKEKYNEHKNSFYDDLISSNYRNSPKIDVHTMSFPGFIAFFYYPGSLIFLIIVLFFLGILASLLEIVSYKLSQNNQIFSALIGQVIAYRLIHFGYVPAQSYLLFGTILLNIFIIYGINKVLFFYYKEN